MKHIEFFLERWSRVPECNISPDTRALIVPVLGEPERPNTGSKPGFLAPVRPLERPICGLEGGGRIRKRGPVVRSTFFLE